MKHIIPLFAVFALSLAQITTEGPKWQGPFADHELGKPVSDTPEVAAAKAAHYKAHVRILETLPVLPQEETIKSVDVATQAPTFVQVPQSLVYQQPYVPQQSYIPQQPYVPQQPSYVVQNVVPALAYNPQQNQNYIQYAEEIPRSELGEVPEVAAARKAHLAAYEEIKKQLSQLVENPHLTSNAPQVDQYQQRVYQVVPQVQVVPQAVQQTSVVESGDDQQSNVNYQADIAAYKQQLQRNLEWYFNPQQVYVQVPQDTPEVAAAKVEHLKLLQAAI